MFFFFNMICTYVTVVFFNLTLVKVVIELFINRDVWQREICRGDIFIL